MPASTVTAFSSYQPSQDFQVYLVHLVIIPFRSLQDLRYRLEPGIIEQHPERLQTKLALADMLMPVDVRTEPFFRIIEMKTGQPFKADEPVKLGKGSGVAGRCQQVVASSNRMAGIKADAETLRKTAAGNDRLQLGKAETEVGPLAGGIFQQDPAAEIDRKSVV